MNLNDFANIGQVIGAIHRWAHFQLGGNSIEFPKEVLTGHSIPGLICAHDI